MNDIATDVLNIFAEPAPQVGLLETLSGQQGKSEDNPEIFSLLFTKLEDVESAPNVLPTAIASNEGGALAMSAQLPSYLKMVEPSTELAVNVEVKLNVLELNPDRIDPINILPKLDSSHGNNVAQVNNITADTKTPIQDIFAKQDKFSSVSSETIWVANAIINSKEFGEIASTQSIIRLEKSEVLQAKDAALVATLPKQPNLATPAMAQILASTQQIQSNVVPSYNAVQENIPNIKLDKTLPLPNVETGHQLQIVPLAAPQTQSNNLGQGNILQASTAQTIISQISVPLLAGVSAEMATLKNQPGNTPKDIIVQLSPAELGRVQIRFSFDTGERVVANIVADNPETMVVLRQKSDMLFAQLKLGGFDNIDLNFEASNDKNSESAANTKNQHKQSSQNLWNLAKGDAELHPQASSEIPHPVRSHMNQETSQIDLIL
ncbi:MAG: flagellar hook-length control protein FliK [Robiginitomaculum sp.]|nr:flagellar hook-length control protein FliK [Robiginitomaculum sp.]